MQACSHHFWRIVLPVFLSLLAPAPAVLAEFVLSERCPPGFELSKDHCELRSLYQMYASLKEGMNVFRSFVARCAECHTPPLFTNQQVAVIGTPDTDDMDFDPGAAEPLGEPTLRGGFKVPSLRNIALTAPYMHSGRFATLREAAAFYTGGRGHAVPPGEELKIHWHIWEPDLSDEELDRLVDFLHTLTDESFKPSAPLMLPSGIPPVHNTLTRTGATSQEGANNHE